MLDGGAVDSSALSTPFLRDAGGLDIPLTQPSSKPCEAASSLPRETTRAGAGLTQVADSEPAQPPRKKLRDEAPLAADMFLQHLGTVKALSMVHFTAKADVVDQWRINAFLKTKYPELSDPDLGKNVRRWWVEAGVAVNVIKQRSDSKVQLVAPPASEMSDAVIAFGDALKLTDAERKTLTQAWQRRSEATVFDMPTFQDMCQLFLP
mgnify:CR=1 FL=1